MLDNTRDFIGTRFFQMSLEGLLLCHKFFVSCHSVYPLFRL
ncbi:hypothetical protein CBM2586_B130514 [Cupriavidus phytorum]|uniref:Uncharacterized protein n=1 Tax=Cupriavidus taiwanensis TaxID=164546 RepID=A0A976AAN1_9BURK|nr:hypothetical protein CBM2586_B130514 [Cupriavidus taiwanensis]